MRKLKKGKKQIIDNALLLKRVGFSRDRFSWYWWVNLRGCLSSFDSEMTWWNEWRMFGWYQIIIRRDLPFMNSFRLNYMQHLLREWASSSVVAALASHARGQAFDPPVVQLQILYLWFFPSFIYADSYNKFNSYLLSFLTKNVLHFEVKRWMWKIFFYKSL